MNILLVHNPYLILLCAKNGLTCLVWFPIDSSPSSCEALGTSRLDGWKDEHCCFFGEMVFFRLQRLLAHKKLSYHNHSAW
jgi:hypothetical protein